MQHFQIRVKNKISGCVKYAEQWCVPCIDTGKSVGAPKSIDGEREGMTRGSSLPGEAEGVIHVGVTLSVGLDWIDGLWGQLESREGPVED